MEQVQFTECLADATAFGGKEKRVRTCGMQKGCCESFFLILLGMLLSTLLWGSFGLLYGRHGSTHCSAPTQDSSLAQLASQSVRSSPLQWVEHNLWTSQAENLTKVKRFSENEKRAWKRKLATQSVVSLTQGCGRMQNRLAKLSDGTAACVRYRHNVDQIQGEMYAYALAELLRIEGNLAPTSLAVVDPASTQWKAVSKQLYEAGWQSGQLVVMTQWLPDLKEVHIPQQLRHNDSILSSKSIASDKPLSVSELNDLIQWSDMVVLDYLTANMDRFMNSLVNQQWDRDIMAHSAHNLKRDAKRQLLVFIDNESSFYHGYNLLTKYAHLHENALGRVCIFRRSSIDALRRLAAMSTARLDLLFRQVTAQSPLPKLGQRELSRLRERMHALLKHIDGYCQQIELS